MYQYPYGNAQQLNLDWLMEQWQTVKQSIDGSLQGEIDRVEAAITDLLAARDAAIAAAGAANTSAGAAAASAQAAAADAATATAQAAAATQERVNAAQAANNAQSYAGTAQTQAAAAQNAAGQAAASASQAAADASDAHDNAVSASGSAVNAAASAAGALQNFQLSDAARQAAQAAATLLQPPATSADIGKALIVKTVGGGTVTAYELGESGGGGTPAIVQTIEDVAIASFDDGTVNPVQQLVVDIEPVQSGSGDPAPDNVRPITGWTGANVTRSGKNQFTLVDGASFTTNSLKCTMYSDGTVKLQGTPSADTSFNLNFSTYSTRIKLANGIKYYWTGKVLSGTAGGFIKLAGGYRGDSTSQSAQIDIADSPNSNVTKTIPDSGNYYSRVWISAEANKAYDCTIGIIESRANVTPDDYEPYTGTTFSITFPDAAGTVYGGTLTNQGTDEWKLRADTLYYEVDGINNYFDISGAYANIKPYGVVTGVDTSIANWMCSSFPTNGYWMGYNASGEFIYMNQTGWSQIGSTSEELNAYAAEHPIQFIIPLTTPVEYTITAEAAKTLLGLNNIWADTGNINLLEYYADSKTYIDEQNTLVKALIAPVLDSMVADTALTANDFRIVDNTLYRITAPVAAGAALTPNTNCTATTIGAILKTLLT